MTDYYNDIKEIMSFINCIDAPTQTTNSFDVCLNAFTKKTGETFLDDRAELIVDIVSSGSELKNSFYTLSSVCTGYNYSKCTNCVVRKYCNSFIIESRKLAEGKPKIIDLFCGSGGLSLGFVQEGFCVALANDIEACCVDTYAHNHPETARDHIVLGDIRTVVSDLEHLVNGLDIDIVVGGPPCQGFSMANRQRLNVAGVFGDVFQLLDRDDSEVSEYAIQASEDIKKYLSKELGGEPSEYSEIRIPNNMFIWATMNSADQGVFPMDTAFKRRWDFTYLGIDDGQSGIAGKKVVLGKGEHRRLVEWNELRKAINEELLTYKVNEDKLMGPYFIAKKALPDGDTIEPQSFTRIFKNKVIMYLFDDAAKQKRVTLFGGCADKDKNQYSKICTAFDTLGVDIFCDAISSKFIDKTPESDAE